MFKILTGKEVEGSVVTIVSFFYSFPFCLFFAFLQRLLIIIVGRDVVFDHVAIGFKCVCTKFHLSLKALGSTRGSSSGLLCNPLTMAYTQKDVHTSRIQVLTPAYVFCSIVKWTGSLVFNQDSLVASYLQLPLQHLEM